MSDHSMTDLESLMAKCSVDERVQGYLRKCVAFHTFPAAGLLIGVFMVDLALEKLGAKPGDKLYAVSETPKCAPDALQVLLGATMGNHRLRIINTGRYAIAINRFAEGVTADGIRVHIDLARVKKYPVLYQWYTNDPSYKGGVSGQKLLEEILCAGRDILAWEPVKVRFEPKEKWKSRVCPSCGEMAPENTFDGEACSGCGSKAYYDKTPAVSR
jgi:formylmethanofuran dehydrogenase subunit E